MTDEQLNEIESRCNAATPGPWEWMTEGGYRLVTTHSGKIYVMCFFRKGLQDAQPGFKDGFKISKADDIDLSTHPDAQFIASARSDIPDLIAEVGRLRTENAALRKLVAALDAYIDVLEPYGDNLCSLNEDQPECVVLAKKLTAASRKLRAARRAVEGKVEDEQQ